MVTISEVIDIAGTANRALMEGAFSSQDITGLRRLFTVVMNAIAEENQQFRATPQELRGDYLLGPRGRGAFEQYVDRCRVLSLLKTPGNVQ